MTRKLIDCFLNLFLEFHSENAGTTNTARKLSLPTSTVDRWYQAAQGRTTLYHGPALKHLVEVARAKHGHPLGRAAEQLLKERSGFDLAALSHVEPQHLSREWCVGGSETEIRSLYFHSALQLHCQDFPLGELKNACLKRLTVERVQFAAAIDLLFTFVTAEFFNSFVEAISRQARDGGSTRIPRHPLATIRLSDGLFPETWEKRRAEIANSADCMRDELESIYLDLKYIHRTPGRGVGLLFSGAGAPVEWIARRQKMTTMLREFGAGHADETSAYALLNNAMNFKNVPCAVPEPDVVAAAAATASLRATLAAQEAANTLCCLEDHQPHWLTVLVRTIGRLCHFVYLSRANAMGNWLSKLPEDEERILVNSDGTPVEQGDESIFIGDRGQIGLSYAASLKAMRDEGAWFIFDSSQGYIGFLSPKGSLVQKLRLFDETAPVIHKHAWEEATLPETFVPGAPNCVTMNCRY